LSGPGSLKALVVGVDYPHESDHLQYCAVDHGDSRCESSSALFGGRTNTQIVADVLDSPSIIFRPINQLFEGD
jgi:hypothetical protein